MSLLSSTARVIGIVVAVSLVVCLASVSSLAADSAKERVFPGNEWNRVPPESAGLRRSELEKARDYALSGGGSGLITRGGVVALAWGDTKRKFDLKSSSKSIGVTALGLAIGDGKMSLDDLATTHHPDFGVPPESNADTGWINQVTLRQLANQSAGFEKPGGYTKMLFKPGTQWHYSDGGPNWLAECVTLAMQNDIESLMFQRVLEPIGVSKQDLHWRPHQYRAKAIDGIRRCEFGSGVHANVEAMARIGLLYLRGGKWKQRQLLPATFVQSAARCDPALKGLTEFDDQHGDASEHYGLLWWNNADSALAGVPDDAFWSWGLYDSLIVVIPSLDIVVARAGKSWKRAPHQNHYDVLGPFLRPIVASVQPQPTSAEAAEPTKATKVDRAPYPVNALEIRWDSAETVRRHADGSDNWPLTWMDNDSMLTAYGDGWGFEPKVKQKLSMGFAHISGDPTAFRGLNVRTSSGEKLGQGPHGIKASGLLMIDGTSYLLARNAGNSQLAWSADRGKTWTWSDWKFEQSFGCPSFINFGRDYAGARDDYVYVVSPDSDSAYEPADRMIMARVNRQRLRDREAYEFLSGVTASGTATWTRSIEHRAAVFRHAERCYRGAMTYNPGLKQYLWCQVLPESSDPRGPRFQGGFGVYAAPEPWGPWSTLFFTDSWDMGPGESSSIPCKWISEDGRTVHLVFSGDDTFAVRRGRIVLREQP